MPSQRVSSRRRAAASSACSAAISVLLLGDQRAQALELGLVAARLGRAHLLRGAVLLGLRGLGGGDAARRASSSASISADIGDSPRRARAASKASGFSRMARMSCMGVCGDVATVPPRNRLRIAALAPISPFTLRCLAFTRPRK
jgi:hypothetical protein